MSSIVEKLQTWTPLATIIFMFAVVVALSLLWYSFNFQEPPSWVINVAILLTSGSVYGVGSAQGSTTTLHATASANTNNAASTPSV